MSFCNFTNLAPVQKTLCFALHPEGRTEEFFNRDILQNEIVRSKQGEVLKAAMREANRVYSDTILNSLVFNIADHFRTALFGLVLPQAGIDEYNTILGGIALEDGTKLKGLNEYINLYNIYYDVE